MSRGFGKVQQRVLAAVQDRGGGNVFVLTKEVFEIEEDGGIYWMTRPQVESVRRALRSLVKAGKIFQSEPPSIEARVRLVEQTTPPRHFPIEFTTPEIHQAQLRNRGQDAGHRFVRKLGLR